MRSTSAFGSRWLRRLTQCAFIFAVVLIAISSCIAQDATDENPTLTLHIYTDLIQLPVLILGPYRDTVPRLEAEKVTVRLGDGEPFHPTHIRPEGNDPITLAILLDVSESDNIPNRFGDALAKLATQSLHADDNVGVYTVDCALMRTSTYAPVNTAMLKTAGDQASKQISPRANKHHRDCGNALPLRDSLIAITNELSLQSGRRVILVVSTGNDIGSTATQEDVHQLANSLSVAIFGIVKKEESAPAATGAIGNSRRGNSISAPPSAPLTVTPSSTMADGPFGSLCESTGGMVRHPDADTIPQALVSFLKTVRDRFILEFPRPKDPTGGVRAINVAVGNTNDFIRTSGITVPVRETHFENSSDIHQEDAASPDPAPPAAPEPTAPPTNPLSPN